MTKSPKFTKESFVRNLAKGNVLVPYLDRHEGWDHEFQFVYSPKPSDDGWHPSGDCTLSVADLYDKATGVVTREKIKPTLQRTFLVGHFWHQVIQDAVVTLGFADPESIERKGLYGWGGPKLDDASQAVKDLVSPLSYMPYHYATGSGDVAPLKMPDWEGIMDIKTMRSQDFDRLYKTGQLPTRFTAKYECQINIYMDFFDQEAGMILAVNKDSSALAEVTFKRNQDLIDTIYAKWEYVSGCLDEGHPPIAEADDFFPLPLTGPVS